MQSYESQKCPLSETNSAQGDQETHKAAHQRHGQSSTPEDRSYLMDKTMCDGRRNIYDSESENRLTKRSYQPEEEWTTKRQIRHKTWETPGLFNHQKQDPAKVSPSRFKHWVCKDFYHENLSRVCMTIHMRLFKSTSATRMEMDLELYYQLRLI